MKSNLVEFGRIWSNKVERDAWDSAVPEGVFKMSKNEATRHSVKVIERGVFNVGRMITWEGAGVKQKCIISVRF